MTKPLVEEKCPSTTTVRQSIDALINEVDKTTLSDPTEQPSSPQRLERLEHQIDMSHRNTRLLASNFDDMQATLQQLVEEVHRLSESLRSASPPLSPKATAKQQPSAEPLVEEGLWDNNGYGLGGLSKGHVAGDWKGEELGFRTHDNGAPAPHRESSFRGDDDTCTTMF